MNEPLLITVGNWGYRDLIISWWLNIKYNTPDILDRVRVVVWEDELEKYLNDHIPQMNIIKINYSQGKCYRNSVVFKHEGWDIVTKFKLQAVWDFICKSQPILYLDPDIVLLKNALEDFQRFDKNKIYIQKGKPYCSGVLYVNICTASKAAFNPKAWLDWQSDDEKYLIDFFENKRKNTMDLSDQIEVLPLDEYPNGLFEENMWIKPINEVKSSLLSKAKLIHFNYIVGLNKKCITIKNFGYWRRPLHIIEVPSYLQPILEDVCILKKKSKYPPHQIGFQIETYFDHYLCQEIQTTIIESEYDYLPIYWTAIAVQNDLKIINKAREWVQKFIEENPDRKCFTVVQHCKGIEGTLNIIFPKDWKIFSTSNPNATKDVSILKKNVIIPLTVKDLPVGKMKLLNNKQPLIGIGRKDTQSNKLSIVQNTNNLNIKKMVNAYYLKYDITNHTTIPLLCSPHLDEPIKGNGPRKYLATFIGNLKIHPIRNTMQKVLLEYKDIIVQDGKYLNKDDMNMFGKLMEMSTFALCPRGFGNTSFRLIEAIEYGVIPVYISDTFSLPFEDVIDWNKCCIKIQEHQLGDLHELLTNLVNNRDDLIEMQTYIYEVYNKYFTYKKCSEYIISTIKTCT